MKNKLSINDLKIINLEKGDVLHALKSSDNSFINFGEAYFSTIKYEMIKAWKRHKLMTLNLIVPIGEVKFVVYDNRILNNPAWHEFSLSRNNYKRLTIPPMTWIGFQGLAKGESMVLNISNIPHDPNEQENIEIEKINYDWSGI